MRRTDREIKDINEIFQVLGKCDTARIGINTPDYPYVVPVNFGASLENGVITIYFHGAKDGLKHTLINRDNRVCVEVDYFKGYKEIAGHVTCEYESVIGYGNAEVITGDEAVKGLKQLLKKAAFPECEALVCEAADITRVYKIVLLFVTGKHRSE